MSLSGILGSATRSLSSFSEALGVIQNNIANAATPGYARQRVALAPIITPQTTTYGLGVEVLDVQSLRDRLLESQVLFTNQSRSFFEKTTQLISQIEPTFRLGGEDSLGESIDNFFGTVASLSVTPEDFTLRREVINSAGSLAGVFRRTNADLDRQRINVDTELASTVSNINRLLRDAASLAGKRTTGPGKTNPTVDTRLAQVFGELSGLTGFPRAGTTGRHSQRRQRRRSPAAGGLVGVPHRSQPRCAAGAGLRLQGQ